MLKIPYSTAHQLKALIGRFKIDSYADVEFIREQINKLPIAEFNSKHGGDQAKANEIWNHESSVTKEDFAWLDKGAFDIAIQGRGFSFQEIEFLEYWIVK